MTKYYTTTLKKGSEGNEVKEWQKFLNSQGYNLTIDGVFGDFTDEATRAYQNKEGINDDGVVGDITWGKAGYKYVSNAPTQKPNTDTTSWDETEKGQAAKESYQSAQAAVNAHPNFTPTEYTESTAVQNKNPGEYKSEWATQLKDLMDSIMNREKFSYNFNEDALYQQYKDKYIQQGKMAMADTMGQAAAMTGGYGNSYAQSVGQQAYQASLDNLNDVIPELYGMALDKYNMEGQELLNQYGLLMDRENLDYGRYRDAVSDYLTERGFDYQKHTDEQDMKYNLNKDAYQKLIDALGIARDDYYTAGDIYRTEQAIKNEDAWKSAQWDESVRQHEEILYANQMAEWDAQEQDSDAAWEKVITNVQNYTTIEGQSRYLLSLEEKGVITEKERRAILSEFGIKPLTDRSYEAIDDGGFNWAWGINRDAKVRDETGTEYTLAELYKKLKATMPDEEARNYILSLQNGLGIR